MMFVVINMIEVVCLYWIAIIVYKGFEKKLHNPFMALFLTITLLILSTILSAMFCIFLPYYSFLPY